MPGHLSGRYAGLLSLRLSWLVVYVAVVHVVWAAMIPLWPVSLGATPIHGFVSVGNANPLVVSSLLLVSSGLALVSFLSPNASANVIVLLVLPQQAALFITMFGGLAAVLQSHYADGVPRPWPFILADQLPAILLAVAHLAGIVERRWAQYLLCRSSE